jgi:hypothetical protein
MAFRSQLSWTRAREAVLFAEAFARKGLSVTSIDPNSEMLVEAKKYIPSAILWQAIVSCNATIDEC